MKFPRLATLLTTLILALLIASSAKAGQGEARGVVETFHRVLLHVMKDADKLGFSGRYEAIDPVVKKSFDLSAMSHFSIGSYWTKLSADERERLIKAFTRMTVATYAHRFDGFAGEKFVILSEEETPRKLIIIKTQILLKDDDPVDLNYALRKHGDSWHIVDIYLKGAYSELATRRAEYSSVLKRKGFDQLLIALDTKVAEIEEKEKNHAVN
jgi:phospholipid transport system substrate-binding protein